MSKISFYPRTANAKGYSPVTVRFHHKGSNFPLASGEFVLVQYFDQNRGTVSEKHPDAAKINNGIRRVVSLMEQAREACQQNKVEPVRENMQHFYALLVQQDVVSTERDRLEKEVSIPLVMLPDLRRRLAKAKEEVEQLEALIQKLDPDNEGDLLAFYFDEMARERENSLAENSLIFLKQTKARTQRFNPTWRIQDVNNETLRGFEQWMLQENFATTTITNSLEKIKGVCYRYGKKLKLDLEDIRQHRRDTKNVKANKNGVVYLTLKQIDALLALELEGEQARSRDQFAFLCLTGLRYLDSLRITPANIRPRTNEEGEILENGVELFLPTGKTKQEVVIPLSEKVHKLLIRNNFDFIRRKVDKKTGELVPVLDWKRSGNFNRAVRTICRQIPSLQSKINISQQRGGKTTYKTMSKHEAIRSHSGRKSLINNSIKLGVNPVAVAGMVGHVNADLIMSTYGDTRLGADKITEM